MEQGKLECKFETKRIRALRQQWVPNSQKALPDKVFFVGRGKFGNAVVEQGVSQAQVDDAPESAVILCGEFPDISISGA